MDVTCVELKVLWMHQAMDHEEILGAIDQEASYRSRCKHYGSGTKRWTNEGAIDITSGAIDITSGAIMIRHPSILIYDILQF